MITRRQFLATNGLIVAGTATGAVRSGLFGPSPQALATPTATASDSGIRWTTGRLLPTGVYARATRNP